MTRFQRTKPEQPFGATYAAVAIIGALLLMAGLFLTPHAVVISYLVAYTATVAIVLGMLLLIAMAHLSGAIWFVVLRRRAEAVVSSLPMLAAFALPLVLFPRAFWPSLLTSDFHLFLFVARTIAYWTVWLWLGERVLRISRRQDEGDKTASRQFQTISATAVVLLPVTVTLAAFDWMMTLSPDWTSSIYGAYYVVDGSVGALALLTVLARAGHTSGSAPVATSEHFHALGKLTLAFVLFRAYLWYAQFFIIWIGDIPREVSWYVVRLEGGWRVIAWIVLMAGFAIPFIALLFRAVRRSAMVMRWIGLVLLAVHYLDLYWQLVPAAARSSALADLVWSAGALALTAGGCAALGIWRSARLPSVPRGDPLYEWSLRYQAH